MKKLLFAAALLLCISGTALAGLEFDKCIKEEKALKAQEAGDCSGLKYLLNPSACFVTRKALKEYASGKCRKTGIAENVDFSVQKPIPEKKNNVSTYGIAGSANTVNKAGNSGGVAVKKAEPETAPQEPTIEQLKEENARLKAEIEQLRKTGR